MRLVKKVTTTVTEYIEDDELLDEGLDDGEDTDDAEEVEHEAPLRKPKK